MAKQYIVIIHNEDNYETSGIEAGIFDSLDEAVEYVKDACDTFISTVKETDGLSMTKTHIASDYMYAYLEWKDEDTDVVFSSIFIIDTPFNKRNE